MIAALGILLAGLVLAGTLLWLPHFVVRRRAADAGIDFANVPPAQVAAVSAVSLDLSTLTSGELKVTSVDPIDPEHERNLRWFAGALGHAAHDPVGRAVAKLSTRGRLTNVREVPGAGISGSVDRHPVRIGAPDWIETTPLDPDTDTDADDAATTVSVEVDERALGKITLREVLRDDAAAGVAALGNLGVAATVRPGVRPAVTRRLAAEVGLAVEQSNARAEGPGATSGSSVLAGASAPSGSAGAGVLAGPADSGLLAGAAEPDGCPAPGVLAGPSGLAIGSGIAFADPSVSSVAAAISIARGFIALKKRCTFAAAAIVVIAVLVAATLILS